VVDDECVVAEDGEGRTGDSQGGDRRNANVGRRRLGRLPVYRGDGQLATIVTQSGNAFKSAGRTAVRRPFIGTIGLRGLGAVAGALLGSASSATSYRADRLLVIPNSAVI
jgi:hypothetical protein